MSFPQAALIAYTEAQAREYAASGKAGNPPPPPVASSPVNESKDSEPEESKDNSGEGDESPGEDEIGSSSHSTDAKFCSEHECIGNFTTEDGTVVKCSDGTYSHAGGISGACSDHGGEAE